MTLDRTIAQQVLKRLDGTMFWVDRDGTHHHVEHMPQGYALNAILWLEQHAEQLWMEALLHAHLHGDAKGIADMSPKEWLHFTPLVSALYAKLGVDHRRALVLGHSACQKCAQFIEGRSFKQPDQPGPLHSWCRASVLREERENSDKIKLSREIALGLAGVHASIHDEVPGMMTHISDLDKLRDIVLSLEKTKTSDIMVLGVFLVNCAETALRHFATPQA